MKKIFMRSKKSDSYKKMLLSTGFILVSTALGYASSAQAEITADPGQKNIPSVINNANKSATININSASQSGISHNKFTQFDVEKGGVILNNSANASATTLSGNIAGNSNMQSGSASLIVNEVNSDRASVLNGMIEVAGKKADVIIANPSGVTCDGCGFINTGKATLTTNSLLLDGDKITMGKAGDGVIQITGNGMNDGADFTALLAKTIKVSSAIHAKELYVSVVNDDASVTSEDNKVGLDIAALGGMYANKITLVANRDGAGINNSGLISAESNLSISSTGELNNSGKMGTASGPVEIVSDSIKNGQGTIISGGDLYLLADSKIDNTQGIISGKNWVNINADTLDNTAGLINGKGISLVADRVLNKNSAQYGVDANDDNKPKVAAAQEGGIYASEDINIAAGALIDTSAGTIRSEKGAVMLAAMDNINLDHVSIAGENVSIFSNTVAGDVQGITSGKIDARKNILFDVEQPVPFDENSSITAGEKLTIKDNLQH